jgi:dCTP deaminase
MTKVIAGVLPSQSIQKMIKRGEINSRGATIESSQVQPASLDLRLGIVAYRVRASFLTGKNFTVNDRLQEFEMHKIDLTKGAILEKGCVYIIPLMEYLNLPKNISAASNAKSSIGRLDLLTRVITDNGIEFDRINNGYKGPLYAEICPRSFSVLARPKQRLNQIRFRIGQSVINDDGLKKMHASDPLVNGEALIDEGLGFSVDLKPKEDNLVGFVAKPHTNIIDLDKINHYNPKEFWQSVRTSSGQIILDPGAFYILVSREAVNIPSNCAAEMAPYIAMIGEFRVHYAGFFDPGFGNKDSGGIGSRGVLEVRCHEAPFVLEHGQNVGRLIYEKMIETPDILYGQDLKSNYQGQGLKLSKHFKSD